MVVADGTLRRAQAKPNRAARAVWVDHDPTLDDVDGGAVRESARGRAHGVHPCRILFLLGR